MRETMEPLMRSLDALQAAGRSVNIFFRDDDVDWNEGALRQLLSTFIRTHAPVNLEIIPARLSRFAIRHLRARQRDYPGLFELNQHGWRHVNHEREGRKCEFGASRCFEQQLEDIANGQMLMNDAFDEAWSPVFTPPWNRCTEATFRALDQLGFAALSKDRGKQAIAEYKFREISITLDLYRWKGEPAMKSPEQIVSELISQMNELDTIGIMLHHKVMDAAAFSLLEQVIEALRHSPSVRFHTFQSLLRCS